MGDELGVWESWTPAQVAAVLERVEVPWWIAGGWAIEFFLGRSFRPHGDVDVLLLRRDQRVIHEVLPGWDIQAADPPGTLRPWEAGEWLPAEVHDIWCRERAGGPWRFQFMLDESSGSEWVSRRDPRIRRPIESIGLVTPSGMPILAPEIQLFYKANGMRPKDVEDLEAALPSLSPAAVRWMDEALALTAPEHPWRACLAQ